MAGHCVNRSSEEFIALQIETNINPIVLGAKISLWQETNGLDKFPTLKDLNLSNEINYNLKAIDILTSDRGIKVFEKGNKANWSLDKILTELQIPKEQKALLLDLNITDREELALALASNYSYSIKIKPSEVIDKYTIYDEMEDYQSELDRGNGVTDEPVPLGNFSVYNNKSKGDTIAYFNTREEAQEWIDNAPVITIPTEHYFNLTVPGGTNYRENEISTPLITPSIKGHAQFSTDNGIGWFRSDDKLTGENNFSGIDEDSLFDSWNSRKIKVTKTRRILELQSDLFQKGRNKQQLNKIDEGFDIDNIGNKFEQFTIDGIKYIGLNGNYSLEDSNDPFEVVEKTITKEEFLNKFKEYRKLNPIDNTKNQFLQLLNKDNNWVTFFVKSIIQDSAKKGYEKVLFPLGDTASKIEGHETITEFISERQYLINNAQEELDKEINIYNKVKDLPNEYTNSVSNIDIAKQSLDRQERKKREIKQFKQEIQRVETEGFSALKPVYNFYENQVQNILKKQGYNPQIITDEYGNQWNEIEISSEQTDFIQLQKSNIQLEAKETSVIDSLIEKFYSTQDDNSSLSTNLINEFNNRTQDSNDITERKIEVLKQSLNAEVIIDNSIADSGQLLPANHPLTKKYGKPVIVINTNNLFSDTVIHEFGHLYIDLLGKEDGVLNQAYELLRGTEFYNQIAKQYSELTPEQLDKEVLATAIGIEGDKIFKQDLKNLSIWQKIKNYILTKLQQIFNLQPTAIEKLASELITGNTRLTGAESYNTIITQRSKYSIDNSRQDTQTQIVELLDKIQSDFTKESIDDENIYKNREGEIFNNSVTKNISKYKKRYNSPDKGDFEIKFDRTLFNKDNILFQLNSPKLPLALTKALNDFINDKLDVSVDFVKNPEDRNWVDAYNREMQNSNVEEDSILAMANRLVENTTNTTVGFENNLLKNLNAILDKAEEYQNRYNQAPLAGNIIHNAIEEYIKNSTAFPQRIIDTDNMLLETIKNIIDKGKANGSIFKTEQIVYSENRQIPGTIDLIEITKSGEVILYDYKTLNSFKGKSKGNTYNKSDEALYYSKGYVHQLLSYGAILNQYGINLASDPYHIIGIEIKYSNIEDNNSSIEITEVRNKSLSDKQMLSLLNSARNSIFNEFASSTQLDNINIKPDIQNLDDLVNRINNYIRIYKKRTKNLSSNLDVSNINKIQDDLIKNKLESDVNTYIAKNNEVIIKSYVNNIHSTLALLEQQKDIIGEIISPQYLQSLNYVLQSTEALNDIKKVLEDKSSDISLTDKEELLKTIDNTLLVVDNNKNYYKDKVKRLSISSFVENSNLMYGLYTEKYKLQAKKQGIRGKEAIDEYVLKNLKTNETEIKVKEINYWTKQYEDGFADLRFLEYLVADPGMSKSQFVQLVKNILDKTDLSIRNKMLDVIPEINNWYNNLSFDKTGDPKKVWKKFIETKKVVNPTTNKTETKLAGAVIPEFISEYRKTYMKYENAIIERERYLNTLNLKSNKSAKDIEEIEKTNTLIQDLKIDRQKVLKEGLRDNENFQDLYENPEFSKLNEKEKEALRFIHKNLLDADNRLYANTEKKLTKELTDGSYIFYLPKDRMSNIEAMHNSDKVWTNFKSKFEDLVRPPADEDELAISQEEYSESNIKFGSSNLDIYGNEIFEVPVYYRNQLEDEELQSYDIPSLLALNHETTITFEESKLVEADLFVIAESLSSKNNDKILKTDSFINKKIQDTTGKVFQKSDQNLVYQAVKSSIDNRLYKRTYKGVYSKGNYQLIKGAEAISKYASTLVLAGNFMSALSTFSQGTIYRFIEASVGEHITIEDWKKGTSKAWLDFPNMLKDTQRFVPESKSNLLIRKFGLETTAKALTNKFVQDNFAKKQLDQATLFSVTSMAEAVVTSNLMYSLLSNIKVTNEKGEFIDQSGKIVSKKEAMSLDEAYIVENGKLILNKNVKYTTFNITEKYNDGLNQDNTIAATEVSRYIRSVYADLYGQYNQDMKSVLQRTIWGKLAMSLRGWLPRGVNRRWRGITDLVGKDFMTFEELRDEKNIDKRFYSQDQKQFQEGHYSTSIRFIRNIAREMKRNQLSLSNARNAVRNNMTDHELANLKRTQYEMAIMLTMAALAMLLRVIALNSEGDDEDKQKIYFAAYLANRIKTELATFINPAEMLNMISNPAASMSVIQRVFDWIWQLVGISYSKEEGFNANINDLYEKGTKADESRALIKTYGLIPGQVKYQQLKSILGLESNNTIQDSFEYTIKN